MPVFNVICDAIARRLLLEFDYNGVSRVAAPYCHGTSTSGKESLRAVEIGAKPGRSQIASGKLWTVAKMSNVRLGKPFVPNDPNYNPDDSSFSIVHCRV